MQTWQVALMMYTTLCVVPFSLYIAIAPSYLLSNTLPTSVFYIGCFLPLPVLFYLFTINNLLKRKMPASRETNSKDGPNLVYMLLQGPYKETRITIGSRGVDICWSGVLLIRRIILLLLHTYCPEAVMRQTLMLTVSMLAMLLHLTAWPCKDRRANIAGIVSKRSVSYRLHDKSHAHYVRSGQIYTSWRGTIFYEHFRFGRKPSSVLDSSGGDDYYSGYFFITHSWAHSAFLLIVTIIKRNKGFRMFPRCFRNDGLESGKLQCCSH